MSNEVVKVPDVGEGVAEVELVSWAVAPGDTVARNQTLAEVMTDKANVEIPSPVNGTVVATHGDVGGVLAVGSPLIELRVAGAVTAEQPGAPGPVGSVGSIGSPDSATGATGSGDAAPTAAPPGPPPATSGPPDLPAPAHSTRRDPVPDPSAPKPSAGWEPQRRGPMPAPAPAPGRLRPAGQRTRATPAVRHRARLAGVDLRNVPGTGPAGRVTHDDLDAWQAGYGRAPSQSVVTDPVVAGPVEPPPARALAPSTPVTPTTGGADVVEEPIIGIRRRIAENTLRSTTSIPHITYVDEVDVTALEELRSTLNDERPDDAPRLTLLPFLIRALAVVLPGFPVMNAHVDDEANVLRRFGTVNVGIATQTPSGLLVPVVHHAGASTIWELAERIGRLAEAARDGTVERADLVGSTITVTSLGPLGGLVTTPVINKPEVAIVGVNKIVVRPVWRDGAFVPRKVMNLSSSFDHRVVDGWDAATFVQALRRRLEQPALLFTGQP